VFPISCDPFVKAIIDFTELERKRQIEEELVQSLLDDMKAYRLRRRCRIELVPTSSYGAPLNTVPTPGSKTSAGPRFRNVRKFCSRMKRRLLAGASSDAPPLDFRQYFRELFLSCGRIRYDNQNVMDYWQNTANLPEQKTTQGHTHAQAANARTRAARLVDTMALQLGKSNYVVSSCRRENELNPTFHGYYIDKDLQHNRRRDSIPSDAIIKMIDVDYYIKWSDWACAPRPVVAYTFSPKTVCHDGPEFSYALSSDDAVRYQVNGGTTYEHKLWDYSNDFLAVRTPLRLLNGWRPNFRLPRDVVYAVNSKRVDEYHNLVLLNPVYSILAYKPSFWPGGLHHLSRRRFKYGNGVMNSFRDDEGVKTSVGTCADGYAVTAVTVDRKTYEALRLRFPETKKPCISSVERHLKAVGIDDPVDEAPVMFSILKHTTASLPQTVVDRPGTFSPPYKPSSYVAVGGFVSEEGTEIGRQLTCPLVTHPDVFPRVSVNNDLLTVQKRILAPRNNKVPPARFEKYAAEFVGMLVTKRHCGYPYSIEDVRDRQNRPAQRGRSDAVVNWASNPSGKPISVSAFMKREPYPKAGAPRNISTVPTEHNLHLSAFTYAFKEQVLRQQPWYVPGMAPREVAERIAEICRASLVAETDFTTMDGSIPEWLKKFVTIPAYQAWVTNEYANILTKVLQAEHRANAVTSNGVAYNVEFSQLSGSPGTTDCNSLANAFITYCALREMGYSPQEAYSRLGAYGGDDGVSRDVDPVVLTNTATLLGMKLKCIPVRNGACSFYGRVFFNADCGQIGSIQDPERTWRKLHLSTAPADVSDKRALANRTFGYLTLDPAAPVTSDWCRKVRELTGITGGEVTRYDSYHAWLQVSEGHEGWPQMPRDLAFEAIAWRLDRDEAEVRDLADSILNAKKMTDLEELWDNPVPPNPFTVDMDGEIFRGSDPEPIVDLPPGPAQHVNTEHRRGAPSGHLIVMGNNRVGTNDSPSRIPRLIDGPRRSRPALPRVGVSSRQPRPPAAPAEGIRQNPRRATKRRATRKPPK